MILLISAFCDKTLHFSIVVTWQQTDMFLPWLYYFWLVIKCCRLTYLKSVSKRLCLHYNLVLILSNWTILNLIISVWLSRLNSRWSILPDQAHKKGAWSWSAYYIRTTKEIRFLHHLNALCLGKYNLFLSTKNWIWYTTKYMENPTVRKWETAIWSLISFTGLKWNLGGFETSWAT